MHYRLWLSGAVLFFCVVGVASATPVIIVGNHQLQPNTPDQTIEIQVSGGDAIEGLNLYAQVADGGPAEGGSDLGPSITADILTGTIFAGNNSGSDSTGSSPQVAARNTLTDSGTVPASGLLATLTLDTTGFFAGSWGLFLENTVNGATDFAGVAADITDGNITIVPEPASALLLTISIFVFARRSSKPRTTR
jgi:hypothetical protein